MKADRTEINGVWVLTPTIFEDSRGYFKESFSLKTFESLTGIQTNFVQDNESLSVEKGVLRGLHFQTNPMAQLKLVRVLQGAIFDVAIDLRQNSATYLKWVGVELSKKNRKQLLVPKGFAHGFCTLEPHTVVAYKVDQYYSKEHDGGIAWNDPDLNIEWPTTTPILSEKDAKLPRLSQLKQLF